MLSNLIDLYAWSLTGLVLCSLNIFDLCIVKQILHVNFKKLLIINYIK